MKTPRGERLNIGIFGKRNAGKSSLLNALTGQNFAVVSPEKGTTTDPVYKSMELLPVGPVVFIDTAGIDDVGEVGRLRTKKTRNILQKVDFAVLVVDAAEGISPEDIELRDAFEAAGVRHLTVFNKADITAARGENGETSLYVSAKTGAGIDALKEKIAEMNAGKSDESPLVSDLISPGDAVILVIPIDAAAPKGRIILPQQQVLRDILDSGGIAIACRETEIARVFKNEPGLDEIDEIGGIGSIEGTRGTQDAPSSRPALVITDSQVFREVADAIPPDIPLTSFSILMSRRKGALAEAVRGAKSLDEIADGDIILISEACTHHRQCGDIATVKLPRLIEKHLKNKTGARPTYEFTSGNDFPEDLSKYRLIIHCGACMINRREMLFRQNAAVQKKIPITNFGIAISHMTGILERSVSSFEGIYEGI
ncbi:MAG: 50S ribosome-binding GTPase [Defluviitaleaceae bacterium]|nr:50S ribosome-binding GTPase [Defluviitaleaceae bacterium]